MATASTILNTVEDVEGVQAYNPALTVEEEMAVRDYCLSIYDPLNAYLRGFKDRPRARKDYDVMKGTGNSLSFDQAIEVMEYLFSSLFSGPALYVERCINLSPKQGHDFCERMEDARAAGKSITIDGYISTSVGGVVFSGNVVLEITANKGIFCVPYSVFSTEREFLLAHGSEFRVEATRQETDSSGETTYYVTLTQIS